MSARAVLEDILRVWQHHSFAGFLTKLNPGLRQQTIMSAVPVAMATTTGRAAAMAVLARRLARQTRLPPEADALFYAPTWNNAKSLGPLLAWACEHGDMVGQGPPARARRTSLSDDLADARLLHAFRGVEPFLALQLLQGLAAYRYFARVLSAHPARTVVIANDHSPTPLGLLHAARATGRRTIYRQHAPVAANYPPLRMTLAVLNDAASRDIYAAAGPVGAEVVILPAFAQASQPMRNPVRFGRWLLLLSRVWGERRLAACVADICRHPEMTRLTLRQHPADPRQLPALADPRVGLQPRSEPLARCVRQSDIVVSGGTGAAVESLHHGTPVVYSAGLDELGPDPHGLVKAGVLFNLSDSPMQALTPGHLAGFYDEAWRARFGRFDPTANCSIARLEEIAYEAFVSVLTAGEAPGPRDDRPATDPEAVGRATEAMRSAVWVGVKFDANNR